MGQMSELDIENNELDDLKSEVVALLCAGLVDLDFEKADGSIRQMTATLKESLLPMRKEIKEEELESVGMLNSQKIKPKVNVVFCYDVQLEAWRSFRIDRLREFNVVDEGM